SLPHVCGGEGALCGRALHQRDQPALWRDEPAARRSRLPRRTLFDRGHRLRRLAPLLEAPGPGPRAVSKPQALPRSGAGAACRRPRDSYPRRRSLEGRYAGSQGARGPVRAARTLRLKVVEAKPRAGPSARLRPVLRLADQAAEHAALELEVAGAL